MHLSNYEKETVINFNEEEQTALIYTYNKRLRKRLSDFTSRDNGCCLVKETEDYSEYKVPKSWIKVNPPRQYSAEERQKLAERAKRNFGK